MRGSVESASPACDIPTDFRHTSEQHPGFGGVCLLAKKSADWQKWPTAAAVECGIGLCALLYALYLPCCGR